jgi:hypothetical protein
MTYQFFFENERDFIPFNGELSNYPDITFGESNTFELYLKSGLESDFGDSGGTLSGSTGFTLSGTTGATLSSTNDKQAFETPEQAYQQVKEYEKYAGYASTEATLGGTFFSENPDFSRASIDGIVTSIRPGADVAQAKGVWGVIESIEDNTEIFGAFAQVDIDLFVVAAYDEYDSEAAVRSAFESDF